MEAGLPGGGVRRRGWSRKAWNIHGAQIAFVYLESPWVALRAAIMSCYDSLHALSHVVVALCGLCPQVSRQIT